MKRGTALSWSLKQIGGMIAKGTIDFTNPVQRPSGQWNREKKSLLIHSALMLFVPDCYAIKTQREIGDKMINVYDIIDGRQRLTNFEEFKNDEFALTDLPEIELDNGEKYQISGLKFSQLPEDVKEALNSFIVNIRPIELEDDDDEETVVNDLFLRLNGGVAVSNEHLALVAAQKSVRDFVQRIVSTHPLFTSTAHFPAGSIKKSEVQMSVLQTLALIGGYEWSVLGTKEIQDLFKTVDVTDEVFEKTVKAFDMLHAAFPEHRKFITKVNLVSFAKLFEMNDYSVDVTPFLQHYATVSKKGDPYRKFTGAGGTKRANVEGRLNGLNKLLSEFRSVSHLEQVQQEEVAEEQPVETV